ncbi:hypothetical protein O6P43_002813 [Quillaja saponaria]|uniref:Uncharacterized protein n=1 Tax=Quillaja saponaria TaxID=32244 RepID=A0AAD7QEI3_QUISA|nr:hypothetical protein O6P43_002813 [Quillaja saponaria]
MEIDWLKLIKSPPPLRLIMPQIIFFTDLSSSLGSLSLAEPELRRILRNRQKRPENLNPFLFLCILERKVNFMDLCGLGFHVHMKKYSASGHY